MASNIILYTNREYSSPYVLSVYATLVEKGLPFELKSIDLGTQENLQPEYQRISLTSRVPTLVHGEFSLSESSAIVEYLEDAFALPDFPSVYPRGLEERARARQIQAWVRSDLGVLREERQTTVIFGERNPQPLSAAGQRAADKLLSVADTLIDAQGNNLFGSWSIADVDFSVMLNRLCANGDPVPEKIRKYVDRQSDRPCVKSWWALARK
ncbi:glutathione transferase [Pollutimonas sp. H1-120]|uniref:glutathione transferase n=1 Tax=Pollutimonas sp. H1-120 TaxID=3148824 RepID=UPI003B52780C